MKFRILNLLAPIVITLAPASWARYTPLFHLDPPGGQRGTVVEVTLSGERLSDFAEVMFYDPDIELAGHKVLDDEHVLCQFRIDPNALLGTHPLRVRTKTGISHLVLFSVGNLEEVFESEPNDKKETAQPIRKGITLNGRAGFEDVDYYSIALEKGERLSVEVEGIRLGEDHWDRNFCLFDPELRLYGPDDELELFADDTPPLTQDPGFVYHAKIEGTYVIAVSDSAFAGFGGDRYRLHVGEFPRPQTFSPLGAKPGETVQVKWLGGPDMGLQTVTVPDDPSLESMSLFAHRGEDLSPTGFPFLIQSYPTHFETEPNNEKPSTPTLSIPCAIEGMIDPVGDADVFEFEGKEGDTLNFRVYARNYQLYQTRFGSSLDSRIAVFGPGGEALVWEDDNLGLDSVGECTLPTDGVYRVLVYDHQHKGGPTFPYRLVIRPREPTLDLKLEVNFLGYQPAALPAYQGNRTVMVVCANRRGFDGPVNLKLPNLPPGVTAEIPPLPAGEVLFPILLTAEANAQLAGSFVHFDATSEAEGRTVHGELKHEIMLAFGRDHNPFLYHTVDTMAVAVVEDASYQIEVLDPVVKVMRGGSAKIRVRAMRRPGFNEPIALSAPWTPPGLACGSPTLLAGEDEIEIEIAASEGASPGVRKMLVVGDYLDYGIASAFFDLEVLSPEGNAGQVASVEVPPEQLMMSSPKVEPTPSGPIKSPPKDAESTEVLEEVTKESKVAIAATPTISFRHEILPLLTKFGCNTAACHGRKSESNPFYLSVFGHDAKNDYSTLLGDSSHPRIVPGHPDQSLLFLKTSGQISHEGGELLSPDSRPYRLVRTWIEEGAHPDPEGAPQIESIEIRPKHVVLDGKGVTRRFTLLATFSDGQSREVSDLGTFTASDPLRIKFDESGLATAGESGEVTILGRYGRLSACAQVIVRPDYRELDWPDLPVANYIDQRVFEKLRLLRLVPAELCEDHVFLRRAYLDIIGVLPTVDETQCFLEDPDPNKRARLIDELLERPEFADVWATKWADVLHVRSFDAIDRKAMIRYSEWIQNSMKAGATPAKLTTDILAAEGGAFTSPATNFYKPFTPSEEIAEDFAQVFLGIRIQCAKCHDHPFDHWTMDDYYSFAAFFGRTYRKNSEDRRQALVYSDNSYGEVKHPKTHEAVAPKFLGGVRPQTEGLDRRAVLADWVVSGTNPWFARNVANRVWEHFFGTGLVSPVDDFRDSNPPTHPHLLEDLANRLVECDFDIKPLIRDIAGSTVYQLSCTPRDPDRNGVKNYSHFPIRRLDAEVLADSLSEVGEQAVKYPYYPLGYRAMELPNGRSEDHFLTAFGRPDRETVCAEERQRQPTLSQGLALMNGQIVQQVCDRSRGRLNRLLVSDKGDSDIVSEIYMAAYCRPPSTDEVDRHVAYLAAAEDRDEAMEDILWAVLNSKEFLFQH